MYKFKEPSYYAKSWEPEDITDEMLAAWRQETEEVNVFNKGQSLDRLISINKLKEDARALFGEKSATLKAINKDAFIGKTIDFDFESIVMRPVKASREAKRVEEQKVKDEQILNAYRERAIVWLHANTVLRLGVDFSILTAIDKANAVAYDKEVARLCRMSGYHSFEGQNCERECAGWDGRSRRCECGNRRVSWEADMGHSFENPQVRAVAY